MALGAVHVSGRGHSHRAEILPGHPLKTYDGYSHPDSVQSNWLYTVSPKLDGTLATCALPPAEQCEVPWNVLMEWDSGKSGDSAFPDIQNVPADEIWLLDGSTANGNCYQIYQGEVLSSPVCPDGCAQGQSCPDLCIEWVGATPVTIPGCVSRDPHALTRLTYRPLILEFGSGVNLSFPSGVVGIVPGDGLAPLWKFASVGATSASVLAVQAMYKIFAWNAAGLTLATENTEWTYADCGALQKWGTNPNNGAVLPGLLIQYPCNMPLNYICVWDFTKYGAIEGHACQPCGDSSRITGAPRVNTTCFAEYPDAIPANNPAGFAARAAVQGGTVTDFISQPIAFDAVRSYWIKSNATVLMNLPNARNTLVRGYSSLPGATTRGVSPDYATGYNLDLAQIWSVDCGEEISYATLETARYLALSSAYCSPDSPQKPGAQIPQSALPTALQGIPPQTSDATARYLVQCSQAVVEPASYVVMDETGFPTPYFADSFQPIPSQSVLGLALTPIVSSFSLYNTGKNPAFLVLQPGVSTALSGVLSYQAPAGSPPLFVRVWVSRVSYTYDYPSSSEMIVVGSVSLVANSGDYAYSWFVTAPDTSYQSVGFDFLNATTPGSIIFVGDVVVSTASTIAQCRSAWGPNPRYGFETSLKSPAWNNLCIMTQQDLLQCDGDCTLGQCRCDAGLCGSSCSAVCVATPTGEHAGAGFGAPGLVVDPLGVVRQTSKTGWDDEERGSYIFTDQYGVNIPAIKLFDLGTLIYTRLNQLTGAYESLLRTDNLWVPQPYIALTSGLLSGPLNTFAAVSSLVNAAAGTLRASRTPTTPCSTRTRVSKPRTPSSRASPRTLWTSCGTPRRKPCPSSPTSAITPWSPSPWCVRRPRPRRGPRRGAPASTG